MTNAPFRLLVLACLSCLVCGHARAGADDVESTQAREVMQRLVGEWTGTTTQRWVQPGGDPVTRELTTRITTAWASSGPMLVSMSDAWQQGQTRSTGAAGGVVFVIAYDSRSDRLLLSYTASASGDDQADEGIAQGHWTGRIEGTTIHWQSVGEGAMTDQGVWRLGEEGVVTSKMHRVLEDGSRIIQVGRGTQR